MDSVQMQWILYFMQMVVSASFFAGIKNLKVPRWQMFLVPLAWFVAVAVIFHTVWDADGYRQTRICLTYLGMLLPLLFWVNESRMRRMYLFAIVFIGIIAMDLIASLSVVGTTGKELAQVRIMDDEPLRLITAMLYNVDFMAYTCIALTFFNRLECKVRGRMVAMLLALAISQHILLLGMGLYNVNEVESHALFYGLVSTVLSLISQYSVFRMIDSALQNMENQRELEQLRLRQDMDYKYYQLAQSSMAEMSAFRHDFRNQLQVAYAVAEEDPARAAGLLGELEQRLDKLQRVRYCENPIVNAILTVKADEAAQAGFRLKAAAAVGEWNISESDLSSLFANLLDNAIEGSQRSGSTEGVITLKAARRLNYYVVQVENPCAPDARQDGGTSKAEKDQHGLGMRILRNLAAKYHGTFVTRVENGQFFASVTLEEPEAEEN